MSAWVVSKEHIDVLVKAALNAESYGVPFSYYHDGASHGVSLLGASELGQKLVSECVASVSHRYPGDDVEAGELPGPIDAYYNLPYVYKDPGFDPTPAEVFKAVHCYDYQSCEHDGWESSEAKAFCDGLTASYTFKVAGYDEAPWGFDEDSVASRRVRS